MSVVLVGIPGASPAQAADACPNAAYRTGPSATLPDCRAYEQVSPADKNGVPIASGYPVQTSPDGQRAYFGALNGIGNDDSVFALNLYRAARGTGWTSKGTNPPQGDTPQGATGGPTEAINPDLTRALVISRRVLAAGATEGAANIYVRNLDSPDSYRFVASAPGAGTQSVFTTSLQNSSTLFWAATPDFDHIALNPSQALLPGDPTDSNATRLYRWDGGALRLVAGEHPLSENYPQAPGRYRVSNDGQRVTFLGIDLNTQREDLYQQVGTAAPQLISRSHRPQDNQQTPRGVADSGNFPSPDGTAVTFVSSAPLVAGQPVNSAGDRLSLYRWTSNDDLVDLLAGKLITDSQIQQTKQVVAMSRDGNYVYFRTGAVLATGATDFGDNLYVLRVSDGNVSLVTDSFPVGTEFRLSPNGARIGYVAGGAVYTYDAAQPTTPPTCASCPAGGGPAGAVDFGYPPNVFNDARSQPMLNDGRIFFDTTEALSPDDGNSASDVYEYVPGQGQRLISSGSGGDDATLGDVTPDGNGVFFLTTQQLVPQDGDDLRDVYEARVDGGLAAQQTSPGAATSCQAAACQGAARPPAPATVPGTSVFTPLLAPQATTFKVGKPSSSALLALAAKGRTTLSVRVGAAGRLKLRARARIGRRTVTIATGSATARKAGLVRLSLGLSGSARRELRRRGKLGVAVVVAYSKAADATTVRFTVKQPRASSTSKGGAR